MLTQPNSFNGKLILEAYKHTELKAEVRSGWATLNQKATLKGLKTLVQAHLLDGTVIPVGSTAYIKEESLHTRPEVKNKFKSDTFPVEFIVLSMDMVEYIVPPQGDAA